MLKKAVGALQDVMVTIHRLHQQYIFVKYEVIIRYAPEERSEF